MHVCERGQSTKGFVTFQPEPEEPKPVETAPEFLATLEPVKVKEGETVTLICRVTGTPQPELTWLVEKRRIVEVKNRSV